MTHYDPRDWGQGDPEPPRMGWGDVVLAAMFLLIAAALLSQCSGEVRASPVEASPPFLVMLPDGTEVAACSARYQPEARTFVFGPCVTVFADGFEQP